MDLLLANYRSPWLQRLTAALVTTLAVTVGFPAMTSAASGIQVGTLVCKGEGGWGAIITSKKEFNCTYGSVDGSVRGSYTGVIRKFGLDLGVTGDTTLTWLVFGPATMIGENYKEGSLAGSYAGIGAEASVALGVGANALVGGSEDSFALQPVSVQVQSGLSIAAAVQTLTLVYTGPVN